MFVLYHGIYPSIMCPDTGEVVVVYPATSAGFSRCISLLREVQMALANK